MVAPTGDPAQIDITSPAKAPTTEIITDEIVTFLKSLNTLMDESAGKTINAEISNDPTSLIPSTIIIAIIIDIIRLYFETSVPTAFAKSSSNVTSNIR